MIEQALAEYIVNALWQVPLIAGGAWLLVRSLRPAPLLQHRLWLTVLAMAVVLPIIGVAGGWAKQPQHTIAVTRRAASVEILPLARNEHGPFHAGACTIRLTATATRWLARLYLATVLFGAMRIARAWSAALRLAGRARETSSHGPELDSYSRRFGVKPPQLRESAEVSSPMIVGAGAPVLLVPEGFARFSPAEVEAALCHELAHVKRNDYLTNMLCQAAALPLLWHPVMYQVQQRIRLTREMVCDAMAAQEMKSRIGYARCLLALASSMLGASRLSGQAQFLGLFSNNAVEERVMRLMETTTMSVRARVARAVSGAVAMIVAGSMAAMFHVTPTMAEAGTGAAPQPVQAAVVAPPTQPESSAAPADRPADTAHPAAPIHPKSTGGQRPLVAKERVCLDTDSKLQMEDLKRQMAEAAAQLNSPEFKHQMEDMKRQMAEATAQLNSPEFKHQMEDMKRQMAKAAAQLNSPELKHQMEDMKRQMEEARQLNSPEFKQQMEDLRKEFQSNEFRWKLEEDVPRSEQAPAEPKNTP